LHALRMSPPDPLTVTDGDGSVARCVIDRIQDGRVLARILERYRRRKPEPAVVVYQAAPKKSKLDDVTERLAELGAAELRVFESSRTVVRWQPERRQKLARRWGEIARAAAKQSRNPFVMETGPPMSWTELIDHVGREPFVATLWEQGSVSLRSALPERAPRIAVVVGPEGGLAVEEAGALAAAGAPSVSLGSRIFRTELSPVVAVCSVLFHYGLIG
ncbi:MAG: 16S rRNA (uracil(1498)-N(3))-methyltransferase, partial [Actinomycetota bacterium]|nr:16S rRNA (uracil(1498)-N(3))-methyltransferase [Actinomycetota bacterium]